MIILAYHTMSQEFWHQNLQLISMLTTITVHFSFREYCNHLNFWTDIYTPLFSAQLLLFPMGENWVSQWLSRSLWLQTAFPSRLLQPPWCMHSSISGSRSGSRPVVLYMNKLTSMRVWWLVIRKVMWCPRFHEVSSWSVSSLVPEWWYLIVFASMFALGIISIEVWPTQMPVWAFILALVICPFLEYVQKYWLSHIYYSFRLCDPYRHDSGDHQPTSWIKVSGPQFCQLLYRSANSSVITELIIGYALPGHPIAMMMFKTWGYIVSRYHLGV